MSFVDDIEDAIAAVEATAEQVTARIASIGDWGTAGPSADEHPLVDAPAVVHPAFVDGWWSRAIRKPAHPGRVGGAIRAIATGLHTADMLWQDWQALIDAWTTKPGDGACATFLVGPSEEYGVVQFMGVDKNSNHMGGPGHGVLTIGGRDTHPNLVTNSIEIMCAGGVRRVNGEWRLVENGVAHGPSVPDDQVIPDPQRPGRGWHAITDYQYAMVDALLRDLDATQPPLPAGTTTKAFGEAVPAIALGKSPRVVTHWQMDPVHRSDPWPQCCAWLRSRG